jgi:hypothetical protein
VPRGKCFRWQSALLSICLTKPRISAGQGLASLTRRGARILAGSVAREVLAGGIIVFSFAGSVSSTSFADQGSLLIHGVVRTTAVTQSFGEPDANHSPLEPRQYPNSLARFD